MCRSPLQGFPSFKDHSKREYLLWDASVFKTCMKSTIPEKAAFRLKLSKQFLFAGNGDGPWSSANNQSTPTSPEDLVPYQNYIKGVK